MEVISLRCPRCAKRVNKNERRCRYCGTGLTAVEKEEGEKEEDESARVAADTNQTRIEE